jgi:hypothetical protein
MKKSSIKKVSFILLLGMLLMGTLPMKSQSNLYVYMTDNSKETVALADLQKITFTETDLVINRVSGDPSSVAFSTLKFFSLKEFETTGIVNVKLEGGVNVWSNDGIVTVKNTQTIQSINIIDLQGKTVVQLQPKSQEINISLVFYPAGIYFVQVADEDSITTKKIIKK